MLNIHLWRAVGRRVRSTVRAMKPSSYKGQYSAEGTGYLGPQFVP